MALVPNDAGTYTDERTGLVFQTISIGESLGYGQAPGPVAVPQPAIYIPPSAATPTGGWDTRSRDAAGKLITNQQNSSQYWMDAGYSGPEPDYATKALYSDAQYAYDNAVRIANDRAAQYGSAALSPAIQTLVTTPERYTRAQINALPPANNAVQNADEMLRELADYANTIANFLIQNAILIVCILVAIFVLPNLLSGASGAVFAGRRR